MTDNGPNYSRNIVQRRQVVPVVTMTAAITTICSLVILLKGAYERLGGLPSTSLVVAAGLLAAGVAGVSADRVHRSLWPEHPDDEG